MLFSQIIPPSSSTTESKSLFFTSLFLLLSCIWGHHYHNSKFHESESEVAQSCPTLSDPMDCSLSGFPIHGIFQARVLEWIAISFSRGSSRPRGQTWVSHIAGRRFTIWATSAWVTVILVASLPPISSLPSAPLRSISHIASRYTFYNVNMIGSFSELETFSGSPGSSV